MSEIDCSSRVNDCSIRVSLSFLSICLPCFSFASIQFFYCSAIKLTVFPNYSTTFPLPIIPGHTSNRQVLYHDVSIVVGVGKKVSQ